MYDSDVCMFKFILIYIIDNDSVVCGGHNRGVCVHVYVHVPWCTVSVSVCVNIHKLFKELTPGSETT